MSRSWTSSVVILLVCGAAFLVASPWRNAVATTWLPAANFAIGVGLVTLSFLELGRAAVAWFTHAAAFRWVAGGALVGLGLFAAGSSSMVHARDGASDGIVVAGIVVAIAGLQWQRRYPPAESDLA